MMKQKYVYILVLVILTACLAVFAACNPQTEELPEQYTLSYCVDGQVHTTQKISGNQKINLPKEPAKDGYIFNGWFLDEGTWTQLLAANTFEEVAASADLTVYAKYTPIKYEIVYEPGKEIEHSNVTEYTFEQHVELLPASKPHHDFKGWFTDEELTLPIFEIPEGSMGNMTLYAQFSPTEYKAVFMDGETVVAEIPYTIETESITPPEVPEHAGYTGEWESFTLKAGGVTVQAKYTSVDYTITYEGVTKPEHSNPKGYDVTDLPITLSDAEREHYIFDGWYTEPEFTNRITEIAPGTVGDLVLYAKWTPVEYTATFMDGETVVAEIPYTIETESITPPEVPEHAGFVGEWEEFELTLGGITVNATYLSIDYMIGYEGVEPEEHENPDGYNVTQQPVALGDAVREHYIFDGWYTEPEFTNRITEIAPGTVGDLVLYAKWTPVEYTATFMDGETVVAEVPFTVETESITPPEVPVHAGYTGEWEEYELIPGGITVNAVYSIITYNITYENTKDVVHENPLTYTVETETIVLAPISKPGYIFDGWYLGEELVTEIPLGSTEDKVLTAAWTLIVYKIELHYDPAWGEYVNTSNPATYTVEDHVVFNGLTCKIPGYVFDGWYTEKNLGEGEKVTELVPGSLEDRVLYAHFVPIRYTITYVGVEGAVHINPDSYTIESEAVHILPAMKDGFIFAGWYTDKELSTPASLLIPKGSMGDVTLYTKWTPITYSIEYDAMGGVLPENPAVFNATQTVTFAAPTREGYVFQGWFNAPEEGDRIDFILPGTVAEDVKLYARWQPIYYSVTYHLYGGENAQMNLPLYNIELPTLPLLPATKPGYTFEGWFSSPSYAPETRVFMIPTGSYGDLVLYAKWSLDTYSVDYVLPDGAEHENVSSYTVEDEPSALKPATLDGWTFVGWYADEAYTVEVTHLLGTGAYSDLVLYAKFVPKQYNIWLGSSENNSYTVTFDLNGADGESFTQTVTADQGLVFPKIPTRAGYVFAGWYDNEDCEGAVFNMNVPVMSDLTLYAKWIKTDSAVSVNQSVVVALNGVSEQKFTFVSMVDTVITFTTWGDLDTYGVLYDADGNVLASCDDASTTDKNFRFIYQVKAGEEYILSVSGFSHAVKGDVMLNVSGYDTVSAGGKAYLSNLRVVSIGERFMLPVPEAREGFRFLGWADEEGNFYTNAMGISLEPLQTETDLVLVEVWKDLSFTLSFDTVGGDPIDSQKVCAGDVVDVSELIPTKPGHIFLYWTLNGQIFTSGRMPESDVTLVAVWQKNVITIYYDSTVSAISGPGALNLETFGAYATDTQGNEYELELTYTGKLEPGQTITVYIKVANGAANKEVALYDIRVYGAPTLSFEQTLEELSIKDLEALLKPETFKASGVDTFGQPTEIRVSLDGEPEAGQLVSIKIEAIDSVGNVTVGYIKGVKLYGTPELTWDQEKVHIKLSDINPENGQIAADIFDAIAKDSFGEALEVTVTVQSIKDGEAIVYLTAVDQRGNEVYKVHTCKVYALPELFIPEEINIRDVDVLAAELLGITAKDSFGEDATVYVSIKQGSEQKAGAVMVVIVTAVDAANNLTVKECDVNVYGAPTLTFKSDLTYINLSNPGDILAVGNYNAAGTDSFGKPTEIRVSVDGVLQAGKIVRIKIESVDCVGNVTTGYVENVKVYGLPEITYDQSKTIFTEDAFDLTNPTVTVEMLGASAKDSFGESLEVTSTIVGGAYYAVVVRLQATDSLGNVQSTDVVCRVYTKPTITDPTVTDISVNDRLSGELFGMTATDTFGQALELQLAIKDGTAQKAGTMMIVVATATDAAGNVEQKEFVVKVYGAPVISLTYEREYVSLWELRDAASVLAQIVKADAKDSFGNALNVTYAYANGKIEAGGTVVFEVSATDCTGNVSSVKTVAFRIYDASGIEITFKPGATDTIKLGSKGEEFYAYATDSFGEACTISFVTANGEAPVAGKAQLLHIAATDKAGNRRIGQAIGVVYVYGMPEVTFRQDHNEVSVDAVLADLFVVTDSFGNTLTKEYVVEGEWAVGNTVTVTVISVDDADNRLEAKYELKIVE